MMTPAELRQAMNELVSAFRRSHGDTRRANAEHIRKAFEANRWLHDQIPNEVMDAVYGLHGAERV